MTAVAGRIAREKRFWNEHYRPEMYAAWERKSFQEWISSGPWGEAVKWLGDVRGRRVLCCGVGSSAVLFAQAGAEVWGFDISERQVEAVQWLAAREGQVIDLRVMPFEALDYPDGFFDLAYGSAILHHVDLLLASSELARVLKPGGRAAFVEPLAENPLLNFARRHLPYRGKHRTEDESPLTFADIEVFGRAFRTCAHHESRLLAMLRHRVTRSRRIVGWLEAVDRLLLPAFPPLRRLCASTWIGVTTARAKDVAQPAWQACA